ncbi:T9SS type B sorting domain-containing protein [Flavobacterium sp.]|uniref:T9SS type B sorting domain-containing protein n=1 Tax=Flavobacterium sp. TaxID=239 RepID=UPI00261EBB23|nr:T9SS type B sorting domain-containing protein [Flavobacterium sp.]
MPFYKQLPYFLFILFFQFTYSQNDCTDALVVCGNSSFNNLTVFGPGNVDEISQANTCGMQENNSLWIKLTIKNAGTLGFTLRPQNRDLDIDFDFSVFGPNATCGNLGTSIRCSSTNPEAAGSRSNTTGMNGSEIDTSEGPGNLGNNFVKWLTVQQGETYYLFIDRYSGDTNFSIDWTGTATFSDPPIVNNTTQGATLDLENCDSDGTLDDKTPFNLNQNAVLAIGTQTDVVATFHTSEGDAISGINPIPNPGTYENTSNPQSIFIRLQNTNSGCNSTAEFNIKVIPYQTPNPENIEECDLDDNGFVTFNLSQNDVRLINGDNNVVVSYHPSANDAVVLPTMYTNQVAHTKETLWAKIKNTVSGCFVYKPFDIILKKIPATSTADLTQCDFEIFPDGLTTFNLNEANTDLTLGDTNLSTKFYLNPSNAQNDLSPLSVNYTNISNPQVIAVRVTDNTTHCYTITQLTLHVNTNPTVTETIKECDYDGTEDGITTFNLADAGFETGGNIVTYFYNATDALLEQNAITTTQFTTQTIYARIENANNCIGINIIKLIVQPLPNFAIENKGILCINLPDKPVKLNTIITDPHLYTYLWTPNGETTQNIDAFSLGEYSVTVTNIATTCFKKMTTNVVDNSIIAEILPATIIDLEDNNTVTINTSGIGNYQYSFDDPNGPYQDSNIFNDVAAGVHFIYVRDKNGCGTAEKEINVLGAPKYFTPNGDGIHDFWNIKGLSKTSNSNAVIYIFDRYGKFIKQIKPISQGWNGTFNGVALPADDYWYTVVFENGREANGNFTLKR